MDDAGLNCAFRDWRAISSRSRSWIWSSAPAAARGRTTPSASPQASSTTAREPTSRLCDVRSLSRFVVQSDRDPPMTSELRVSQSAFQIIRLPQVCSITGLRRSMIYRLEAEQGFPSRIKIGIRAVGWIESEVQAWVTQRVEASRRALRRREVASPLTKGAIDTPPRNV
jgi:prophage regulatory protein